MKYILDTNIISEIVKPRPDFNTISWIQDHTDDVAITSVSLEELYFGIFLMPDGKRKQSLKESIDAIVKDCTDRTLAFDAFCGYLCAEVHAAARKAGHAGTIEDFMIAAICLRHNATLVTRNVKDFDYVDGLDIIDPYTYESPVLAELKRREAERQQGRKRGKRA